MLTHNCIFLIHNMTKNLINVLQRNVLLHFDTFWTQTLIIKVIAKSFLDIGLPSPNLGIRTYKGVTKPSLFCLFKCVSPSCLTLCVKLVDLQTFESGPCHAMIILVHFKLKHKKTKRCEPNHVIDILSVRRVLRIHIIINTLQFETCVKSLMSNKRMIQIGST